MMNKLTRSSSDRIIAGVCGGLGEALGISTFWIRLLFVFGGGIFLWVYIALTIFVPSDDDSSVQ